MYFWHGLWERTELEVGGKTYINLKKSYLKKHEKEATEESVSAIGKEGEGELLFPDANVKIDELYIED